MTMTKKEKKKERRAANVKTVIKEAYNQHAGLSATK